MCFYLFSIYIDIFPGSSLSLMGFMSSTSRKNIDVLIYYHPIIMSKKKVVNMLKFHHLNSDKKYILSRKCLHITL